ncbi:MAG: ATP-dependent Clp protease ATP-binding subunit ClpX [Lachnospiraceae bacterium]|nr:ATP-dependent Clp protease ATP-binding subunit ClpX [Lachnospiraceae bacterium]
MSERSLAELAMLLDDEESETIDKEPQIIKLPSPKEIKAYLDRFVVGQEQAKKTLAVAAYNHGKRISDTSGLIRKSNVMLIGPSGCGKTLLVETLAACLRLPMVVADATSLTESGYSGNNVEHILTRLYLNADGDKELAERGIVFIDEVDKLACRGFNPMREAYCRGVQQGLLKIVEGGKISTPRTLDNKNRRIEIETKNILFICGGAFSGLELPADAADEEERPHRRIGFIRDEEPALPSEVRIGTDRITPEDLISYGMTQEFVGRFPVLVRLEPLNEADMIRIISETDNCLVREYRELLSRDGIDLKFEPAALRCLARCAMHRGIGARGLRTYMEEVLRDVMFEASEEKDRRVLVTVSEEMIRALTDQDLFAS